MIKIFMSEIGDNMIKTLRYVIKEKNIDKYLDQDDCFIAELEFAYFWLDEDDAYEYIKSVLKNKKEYEVIFVRVSYEILNMSEIGE